jgi:hypothetical protein
MCNFGDGRDHRELTVRQINVFLDRAVRHRMTQNNCSDIRQKSSSGIQGQPWTRGGPRVATPRVDRNGRVYPAHTLPSDQDVCPISTPLGQLPTHRSIVIEDQHHTCLSTARHSCHHPPSTAGLAPRYCAPLEETLTVFGIPLEPIILWRHMCLRAGTSAHFKTIRKAQDDRGPGGRSRWFVYQPGFMLI